jgi:cyclase
MLKRRVIITLQLNDGVLFRTKQFRPDYRYTQAFLGSENADEVTIIDITRYETIPPLEERKSFVDAAMGYARFCYTPLTIGGGIRTMDDVHFALTEIGADKVLINTAALTTNVVKGLAEKFGAQAIVVGIDCDAAHNVLTHQGTLNWGPQPAEVARLAALQGAGEIFLTSIERDGSLRGYDLELLRKVVAAVDVPVVIAGGCGNWGHIQEAFAAGADGAATSNIHHLTDTSLRSAKEWLIHHGARVRPASSGAASTDPVAPPRAGPGADQE